MMDIKCFINRGGQGALSVQKNEKISTHTKIKFYIIFIFFSTIYNKNYFSTMGKGAGLGPVEFIFLTYLYIISSM